MKVGCCSIKFFIHGNRSLKEKRRVTKAIKDRVRNKFNVSIAEVGDHDVWQNLHLGICTVSPDSQYLDGLLNQVIDFIDNLHLAEMTDCQIEMININHGKF